jgi:hypothetical protein
VLVELRVVRVSEGKETVVVRRWSMITKGRSIAERGWKLARSSIDAAIRCLGHSRSSRAKESSLICMICTTITFFSGNLFPTKG